MVSRKKQVWHKMRMKTSCNCADKCVRFCPKPEREMTHEEFIDSLIAAPRGSEKYNSIRAMMDKLSSQRTALGIDLKNSDKADS